VALTRHNAATAGNRHKELTSQECKECKAAHNALKAARKQYWRHVERHRCRVTVWPLPSSTSGAGLIKP
jgi:hypothetical protein